MPTLNTIQTKEQIFLGSTEMQVYRLGFGGHEISASSPAVVDRLLNTALDQHINLIDTAECYGKSEELIGKAIGHRRNEYYLLTKCGHAGHAGHASGEPLPDWHPRLLEHSIERSLKRLRTDYLDIMQLHNCPQNILRRGDVLTILQRAQQAGKIRYLGYSGDRVDALYAVQSGAFDTLQTTVNIADQEAIDYLIPLAKQMGMGVIAKHSLANVAWLNPSPPTDPTRHVYWQRLKHLRYPFLAAENSQAISIALRFTLSIPGVDAALVGTVNPERFAYNTRLLSAGPLPSVQYAAIRRRWQRVTWWRKYLPGSRIGWHARV